MRKVVLMLMTITLLLVSCKNDIYIPRRKTVDICRVEWTYYPTIQEAADSIVGGQDTETKGIETKAVGDKQTIHLLENITEHYPLSKRSSFSIPEEYTESIEMNFEKLEYCFSNSKSVDHFFRIMGGNKVDISSGTSVILENSAPDPAAIYVNTKVVCLCDHCIDDRRKQPHALEVDSEGTLVIDGESELNGDAVVDGGYLVINDGRHHFDELIMENGAEVDINRGEMVFDDISGNGKVTMIDGDVTILDIDKSNECKIEISGGTIRDPHPIDDKIVPAIIDPDNVTHIIIHEWDVIVARVIKEPTCTEDGLRYVEYKCHWCPATLIIKEEVIPALGHEYEYEDWYMDDTDHWHECTRCHLVVDEGPHNKDKIVQDGADGHHWVCTVCGYATKTEPHVWDGKKEYCTICGYRDQTGGGGGGGFVVVVVYKEPLGDLEATKEEEGLYFEIEYVSRKDHQPATYFEWTVIGQDAQWGVLEDGKIWLIKKYDITHQVNCVYGNDAGWGSSYIVV